MNQYVTALLMAVFYTVALLIAFAWGPSEKREPYEIFYTSFRGFFRIDLPPYVLESDQDAAIRFIAGDHQVQRHLICLRHFVASLKTENQSFGVGNLVKARTRQEFELVKSFYDSDLARTEDGRERSSYARLLKKAGLRIAGHSIVIEDADRWDQVSMWRRIETWTMPKTTNCEESMNDHLNEDTARRNPFWRSVFFLAAMTFHKTQSFRSDALQNFKNMVKRSKT
jgi:hypothetical protein